MKPSIIFKKLLKRTTGLNIGLALILAMAGCGGGGGGGGGVPLVPAENVTISGKVDDGTANSPIPNAECRFVNLGGGQRTVVNANENGEFRIVVPPNVEGHISCSPQSMRFLKLSTFSSTMGRTAGETITGEKVDPATTIVAQIIESEQSPTPTARKEDLLRSIETAQDRYLTLLVELSTRMYAEMLHHNLDVNFADSGGDGGGNGGGNGDGGGVGGDAGDGGDKSPIANARCDFVIGNSVGGGWSVLYNAALADFREDGVLNRNDLKDIRDIINNEFKGREKEIMAAFEDKFPLGFGQPYSDTTDEKGEYFLPIPPNVPGFVRCMPPGQEKLVIATYEPELLEGEKRLGESVNPATTVFSTNVATKLDKDLDRTKDNYINGIEGLEVIIGLDGGSVTGFTIDDSGVISGQAVENKPAKWVAFSATALFNMLYKNGTNIDYLAALDDLTADGKVDAAFLQSQGLSMDQAEEYQKVVNADVITAGGVLGLGEDLNSALNTARINVLVTDATGGIISGAGLRITGAAEGIICENCPLETTGGTDQYLLLTGVPLDATDITVEASKEGYEPIPATAKVVAFATVDLTIELANQFTLDVRMAGNGTGTVTGSSGGIDCAYADAEESGTCNADLKSGTLLTLTAVPDEGSTFTGWGGDCSGIGPCVVTMDRARSVTATFTTDCTYSISPESMSFTSSGGTGSITVTPSFSGCTTPWSTTEGVGWITITSDSNGNGSGTVNYTVSAHTGTTSRSATITVAGNSHTVTQEPAPPTPPTPTFSLTVQGGGDGTGTVTSSPGGINCSINGTAESGDCIETSSGSFTLTATQSGGSIFTGWSGGGCSGTSTCTVTMDQSRTVTANFTARFTLTVQGGSNGTGTVSSSPSGISCSINGTTESGDCSETYNSSTRVTLTPDPTGGSTFSGWSGGGCSGTSTCIVTMDQSRTITANFSARFTLTVQGGSNGTGTVSSSPSGISCSINGTTESGDCSEAYNSSTRVTLTPDPTGGSTFSGWSGGGCSGTSTCIVTMDQSRDVTANFTRVTVFYFTANNQGWRVVGYYDDGGLVAVNGYFSNVPAIWTDTYDSGAIIMGSEDFTTPPSPSGDKWLHRDFNSPDLSTDTSWQGATSISYDVAAFMDPYWDSIYVQAVLHVRKPDLTESYFSDFIQHEIPLDDQSWNKHTLDVSALGMPAGTVVLNLNLRIFYKASSGYNGFVLVDNVIPTPGIPSPPTNIRIE